MAATAVAAYGASWSLCWLLDSFVVAEKWHSGWTWAPLAELPAPSGLAVASAGEVASA